MKKNLFFIGLLMLSFLTGCKEETTVTPIVKPKTFPLPATVSGLNLEIDGKPFYVIHNQTEKWGGISSASWTSYNGIPNTIRWSASFYRQSPELDIMISMNAPVMKIIDPDDTTFKFPLTYNYTNMVNHFRVGKYPVRTKEVPSSLENGYLIAASYVEKLPNGAISPNNFGGDTYSGSQEGSKWEIVKVEEVYGQGIYITCEIDCKIYFKEGATPKRVVGTIQFEQRINPFW